MKKRIGILFGGLSGEHEVSIESARNIYEALDKDRYEAVLVGMDKGGAWRIGDEKEPLLKNSGDGAVSGDSDLRPDPCGGFRINAAAPVVLPTRREGRVVLADPADGRARREIDVFFPIAHGTYGEDGCLQGLLRLLGAPFVGAGVLGSAVAMDKEVMKRLFLEAGIPSARYAAFRSHERGGIDFDRLVDELGLPLFIKPCNLGSSVGVSRIESAEDFEKGVDRAFCYDTKILIEENVVGREVECAVLGNEAPEASLPGEIHLHHDFYSYKAKYLDPEGAGFTIPADLDQETIERVQDLAIHAFQVLECAGMARVDFFLKEDGSLQVNEVNTLPGFTRISMYPKLWEATGLPYAKLLDRLVELALEAHEREARLKRSFH